MAPELLTLRDLRVQTLKERREGRLTKIPNSFYEQIKNLEKQKQTRARVWSFGSI